MGREISEHIQRKLYAESMGRCMNPDCQEELFKDNGDIIEKAHIIPFCDSTDNSYENLIVLCPNCHTNFDKNSAFSIDEVKKLSIYRFSKYSEDVQNFLLKKFNETISSTELFNRTFNKEEILRLLVLVLGLNESIVRLIDNFDFTAAIPKIVIYLEDENTMPESMQILLGYLHTIGIDIVIFNPSGLFNINNVIKSTALNNFRLDVMKYDSKYNNLMNLKQGVFSRFLRR